MGIGYRCWQKYGDHRALHDVDWQIKEGEWWGVVGPNGSGKSTLLQLIAGTESLSEGQIRIDGQDITSYSRKDLSRMIAVLRQDGLPAISYSVRDVVEMGRYPYQNWLGRESADGARVVDRVLEELGLMELAERPLDSLSGGQRRWVALAKVMAQEPRLSAAGRTHHISGHQISITIHGVISRMAAEELYYHSLPYCMI